MKTQIKRLSPHQNAKVFALLMALSSLIFVVPMFFAFSFIPPGMDVHGSHMGPPPAAMLLVFPVMYFVAGYIMVAIGCMFYNFMYKFVGGFEFETDEQQE